VSQPTPEFDAAMKVAIAGVLPAKDVAAAKKSLQAGDLAELDLRLHLRALVTKGEPTDAAATCTLLNKAALAWLIQRMGCTKAALLDALQELANEAIANGGKVRDDLIEKDHELLKTIAEVQHAVVARLPRTVRDGSVKVAGRIEPLTDDESTPLQIAAEQPAGNSDLRLLTAECAITAAGADGGSAPPRFSMTAYNGGAIRLDGWKHPVVIDLQGLNVPSQRRPIRFNHSKDRGVGHTERITVAAGDSGLPVLVAEGVISRQTAEAQEIIASSRSGFPWQASIGATADQVQTLRAGAGTTVNGRAIQGPAHVVRRSTLAEISFVDLGADDTTSVAVAAQTPEGDQDMNFEQWLRARGFDPADINDAQRTSLKAMYDADQDAGSGGAGGDSPDPAAPANGGNGGVQAAASARGNGPDTTGDGDLEQVLAEAQREGERRRRITAATAEVLAERPELSDHVGRLANSAIEAGWDSQRYQLELLRIGRGRGGAGSAVRRDEQRDGRVVEAALCLAGGLENPDKAFDEPTLEAAGRQFGSGLGLGETLLMFAQQNGYRGHGTSNVRGLLQCAFSDGQINAAGGFSTLSLPGILSNVANKFLRAGFDAVESTWRAVAATRPVRDFKQVTSYSLTGGFQYEKVGPGGELKHATAGEVSYTNQAETFGRMFAITRQDIINDDLGALTQVPRRLGRGAALKLNEVFWKAFLDNAGFFKSANKNYADGSATALDLDALTQGEQLFLDQTDPDGNPLGILPTLLLVPNALHVTGSNLMNSTEVRPAGGSSKTVTAVSNPHAGKFEVVRSSYLSTAGWTGASTKAWYLLASPGDMPVIEVAFLNGRQQPVVESADADFNVLGIQMRGYHDFGVALQEPRGGVKMKGEA